MLLESLTPQQKKLVDEIATKNGFDEFEIEVKPGSQRGENFMSIIKNVKITDKTTSESLNIFMKCAMGGDLLRQQIPVNKIFEREIDCYEHVFPKFRQIHDQQNPKSAFPIFATLYGYSKDNCSECIALENLRMKGFKMCDKKKTMDKNHIKLVLEQYGKIHAYSFAIKRHHPEEYKKMQESYINVFKNVRPEEESRVVMKRQFDDFIKVLDDPRLKEAMQRYSEEAFDIANGLGDKKSVLIHGDSWCNNFLFDYKSVDEPEKPTNICLIDWQISSMATPAADLSYFLCSCAPKEVLHDYEKYLRIYYNSLSKTMEELNCCPEELFTYTDLLNHWKKYCKFGLYIAIMIIKVMLCEASEAPDLQVSAESGQDILDAFSYDIEQNDEYVRRISDIIEFMLDNGFL